MKIGRFFEKTKLELTALTFVTTRPLPSKLRWHSLLQKLKNLGNFEEGRVEVVMFFA
jgi:hypothetical protein